MKGIKKKLVIILLLLLALGSCSKKEEGISPTEKDETPAEVSSGFSFSRDENLRLFENKGKVYIQAEQTKEVLWDQQKLQDTDYREKIFESGELSFSLEKGELYLFDKQEVKMITEGILDSFVIEDKLLYSQEQGIFLLNFTRKIPQLIKENVQGEPPYQLKNFKLLEGGKYFLYYNEEESITDIYLSEALEHVMSFDGRVSATSWVDDSFLFEDQENINRIGFYQISSEEVSKFNLTTKNEKVLFSPEFDSQGRIRFISEKDGILSLNKLDAQTQMVKKINMMKGEDLIDQEVIDDVHVFRFKNHFFYSYDDNEYHFYALESDGLNFTKDLIFVVKDTELKVVEKDTYKSYSLKGKPTQSLGTSSAFYYTYEKDGKQWLDRIKLDL